jgi:hypothetical protein
VPHEVIERAKAAFTQRTEGEVAVLTRDSLVDDEAAAWDHRLRFEHPDLQIDLRILGLQGASILEGKVYPSTAVRVELQSDKGDVLRRGEVADGAFALGHVPPGVVRLCLEGSAAVKVCTDWFRI